MTILNAAFGPDGMWIGADSQASINDNIVMLSGSKWTISPDRQWALASAGETTHGGILFNDPSFDPTSQLWPTVPGRDGLLQLLSALRSRLDATTEPRVAEDGVTRDYYFSPLIVWAGGGIWRANSTLYTFNAPYETDQGGVLFDAAGVGSEYALGAMFVEGAHGGGAEQVVRAGLDAAVRFSSGCDHPLIVERLGGG